MFYPNLMILNVDDIREHKISTSLFSKEIQTLKWQLTKPTLVLSEDFGLTFDRAAVGERVPGLFSIYFRLFYAIYS